MLAFVLVVVVVSAAAAAVAAAMPEQLPAEQQIKAIIVPTIAITITITDEHFNDSRALGAAMIYSTTCFGSVSVPKSWSNGINRVRLTNFWKRINMHSVNR